MPTQPDPTGEKGTCFVVMGFGKKTDFETGRVLDLDRSYRYLIKPAVEAAGLKCIRADEVVHSGMIDVPMYELLLEADIVVADLSTSNRNAIYELGVRHALRPYTTVIIAEEQMLKSPLFDLNHIVFRAYRHLGEDIGVSEANRFTSELTKAIKDILAIKPTPKPDSPIYTLIQNLTPPSLAKATKEALAAAQTSSLPASGEAHSERMQRVDAAQKSGDWLKARFLLEEIRGERKAVSGGESPSAEDPYILQRLALATYKSKYPSAEEAFKQARDLLSLLDPQVSNDTETLGLWGSLHKRMWDMTKERSYLDQAIRGYERGFYLRNDFYNGINYAYLLNERAAHATDLAESIADFVQARRVRREVIEICQQWLSDNPPETPLAARAKLGLVQPESDYWLLATIAEAYVGLEEESLGQQKLEEAFAAAPEEWMKQSTQEQVTKLKTLLTASPLKKLPLPITQG